MDEQTDRVQSAVDGADNTVTTEERALVRRWEKTLEAARKADEAFRKRVLRDRAFATGEALAGFEVSTNLVQATIDTLIPFLYAKDPDVDVVPQDQVAPPYKPRLVPPQPPGPPVDPATGQPMLAPDGLPISPDPQALMAFEQAMAEYQAQQQAEHQRAEEERARNDYIRRLSQTIEIVVSRLWHKAKLKAEAKRLLRAAMTSAEGWLKVSLQGDLAEDPQVQKELHTLNDQLARVEALRQQVAEGAGDLDEQIADLEAKIAGAQARLETYIGRCLVIDWVDTLDMQWPQCIRAISEYVNSPWGADATYYTLDDAVAEFKIDKDRLAKASRWKPPVERSDDPTSAPSDYASEAWTRTNDADADGMLRAWEIHSRKDNMIYTWFEGTDFWAKPPRPPRLTTTRFYPYFLLALYECDAERHPQSLAWRLSKLQEEFASARSNFAEVRRRAKPGVLFDATNIDDTEANRITASQNQEWTPVKPVRPGEPIANSFAPKPYAQINPGLYDTQPIRSDMETVSGAQEALSQGVQVAKTATEAEIQQQGFGARTGYSRDCLDMMLDELAQYTAELALQGFAPEQVKQWAGPHAVWPQGIEREALDSLVYVAIRAGSTGKPNTAAERQAWSATMPLLRELIEKIGLLRGADQQEVADKLTELLRETVARTGDRMDVDRFLPMPSPMAQAGIPAAGAMGAGPMPLAATNTPIPEPEVPAAT